MTDLDGELKKALSESEATASERGVSTEDAVAAGPPGVVRDASAEPKRRNIGLLVALLVVAGGILTLVFTSFDSAAIYSVTTDELVQKREQFDGRTLRVEGDLVKGSLRHRAEPCEYRFVMEKNDAQLHVRYSECVVPDTFRDVPDMDVQVTAEGQLSPEGHFEATHIMAKCPSKYEMRKKAAAGEESPHADLGTASDAPRMID